MANVISVLGLPELQVKVCSFLTPKTLAKCTLVSRQWRELFTPHLWSDICIDESQKSLLRKPLIQKAFRRNRLLIRSFATTSDAVLDSFYYLFEDENVHGTKKRRKAGNTPDQEEVPETQLRKLDLCWSGPKFRSRREQEEVDAREQWSGDGEWGDEVWAQSARFLVCKSPYLVDLSLKLCPL